VGRLLSVVFGVGGVVMRPASFGLALLGLALVALPSRPADPAPFRWDDRWASKVVPLVAPLAYADQCLVLSGPDGVAVICFDKDGEFGVRYQFRCWDLTTEKSLSGVGRLYDKPLSAGKAETVVRAGPLRVDWSYSAAGKGWVYWWPEAGTRAQFVRKADYDRLDLKRLARP
jgi:hypothetical protein